MGGAVFPSCCLTWGQTMVEVVKIMVTSFKRPHACTAALSTLDPAAGHRQPLHAFDGDSWTLMGMTGSVSCGVTAPFSWVLVHSRFCLCPPRVCFPVLCKFWWFYGGVNGNLFQEVPADPGLLHPELLQQATADLYLHRRHSDTVLAHSLWVWCVFCVFPRSEQLRRPGALWAHSPRLAVHLNHLPGPSHLVSRVRQESTVSGVPYVSSEELVSGCDSPGRCQPSWLSGRRASQLGACSQFGGRRHLWGWDCSSPLPSGSGCHKAASVPPGGEGLVHSWLALLWYSLNPLFCEQARLYVRFLG